MSASRTFPLNAWYAATWDAELRHELLPRTITGIKMVLYRTENGDAVAAPDSLGGEGGRNAPGALRKLAVAVNIVTMNDGRRVRIASRLLFNQVE